MPNTNWEIYAAKIPDGVEIYYRYSTTKYAPPLDEYDSPIGNGRQELNLELWPVLKKTPKGVWVGLAEGNRKFILLSARKKFACSTIAEAKESFKARKRGQI